MNDEEVSTASSVFTGVITAWNHNKGFGFLCRQGIGDRASRKDWIRVSTRACAFVPKVGNTIRFEMEWNDKAAQWRLKQGVTLIDESECLPKQMPVPAKAIF